MTLSIALLLGLIVVALVLFSFEWVSSDVVALGLLLALILTGLLPVKEAFAGFGSETVLMIFALLVMTSALVKTGMVDLVAQAILRHAGTRFTALFAVILLTVAGLSAFISNTAAAALFLPIVLGLAAKAKVSPSRLLMPVAFASILTSSVTLISTSTNLVVSGLMTRAGLAPLRMFELAPVGIPIAVVGLAYMFFIGRKLIPDRAPASGLLDQFGVRSYITEVLVLPDSPLVHKTLAESNLGRDLDLEIVRVLRKPDVSLWPRRNMTLRAGDVLLVRGAREDVLKVKDTAGIEIRPDVELSDPDLRAEDTQLVEALVVPRSPMVGRTLRLIGLRERYRVQVLAINRHGRNLLEKLSHTLLRVGDVLLVQGRPQDLARLSEDNMVSVLNAVNERRIDRPRAWRATIIFAGSLALATFSVLPLPVAVLLGAFAIFLTRCISPTDAYRDMEWRAVILIACMLALGEAMMRTGTATYLAQHVATWTANFSPGWLLGGFFVLTVALTQPMSNQAAAAVLLPIAVQTATHAGLNPRAFAIMIAVAASCSYLTPLEPACLMVYGPGHYRFIDFVRVGAPLTLLLFLIALVLVPRTWPLL
ncbi:SLC13 family permease [Opitutus terrae]|uniref:TrkA-C domain protein n=1 Tax=Opitutus terrae (strain DSM 11246 / JCM 15787 / PB90-1) TaxID=452637 RepID=B1ZZA4_OPITP|nr:SLC13 family permease [Opitutus terrae]ACB77173.1 TrkA-C domain protein [Opitutus terrae PB90-1]